jgi:pSer/pThr/pTyr-binding forkhead associated (FHA) protein
MPIKLQVAKHGDDAEPADYLFEQEEIRIGRGSDNDLTLPDQKVSSDHALIQNENGQYLLTDQGSKNHTYVDSQRVGEGEPYVLQSGDVFRVGDFMIEFVPLFMPSSEQTAFAESDAEDENPFERHAAQFVNALEGLAETYTYAPREQREAAFREALGDRLDGVEGADVLRRVLQMTGDLPAEDGEEAAEADAPSASSASAPSASAPSASAPSASAPSASAPSASEPDRTDRSGARDASVDQVLDTLLESTARMISIPSHFWREFSGNTVVHPPEKATIHKSSVDDLRDHLLEPSLSEEERERRLTHLREAVNTLVAHNVAMLAGYKKSVMAGSKTLLQKVNPVDAVEAAQDAEDGVLGGFFGGSAGRNELDELEERWKELFHGEWGAMEKDLFRPTYIDTYLDRMAKAWDVDKAEIVDRS